MQRWMRDSVETMTNDRQGRSLPGCFREVGTEKRARRSGLRGLAAVLALAVALVVSASPLEARATSGGPAMANIPELPARYDAREAGRTSPARDQGAWGSCWAFAALLAIENSLLPQEAWDFSEDHMLHNPNFNYREEVGGDYMMAASYLLAWQGPVTEAEDAYGDGVSPEGLRPSKHVQEVRVLPERDQKAIKQAVLETGGVQTSLYTTMTDQTSESEFYNLEARAYCYPYETEPNHDVVIVGWDDNFPKEAFPAQVEGNGAYLCENSWGSLFGDHGFFYVSYYDKNIGKTNAVYSKVEPADNYDFIYQSDLCGWIGQLGYGDDIAWGANVYTAAGAENLRAAGFYAVDKNTEYQVYVARNLTGKEGSSGFSNREKVASGRLEYAGFYTIPFDHEIALEPGERFAVIIALQTPGAKHPIAIEFDPGDGRGNVNTKDGEGYLSFEGRDWVHVEGEQNCNVCLKAYTSARQPQEGGL